MSETIKKIGIPTLVIATALMLMAPAMLSTAFAIAPTSTTRDRGLHFVGQPDLTVNKVTNAQGFVTSASLSATGEVAGAGTGGEATLTSTAVVTEGCVNRGGNEPQGLQEDTTTVTGSETFTTEQGRGTFDVTTDAITTPSEDFSCPSANMTPVLVSVDFTDITLTITTNEGKEITATFADQDP